MTIKSFYIAGPMTGIAEFNFPAFDECRDYLRDRYFTAISPADMDRADGFDEKGCTGHEPVTVEQKQKFARNDIGALMEVDAILLLPGWRESTGATNESKIAVWLGLETLEYRPSAEWSGRISPVAVSGSWAGPQQSAVDHSEGNYPEIPDDVLEQNSAALDMDVLLYEADALPPIDGGLNPRAELLLGAEALVNGNRNVQYGDPNADFQRTADMWNAYLAGVIARQNGLVCVGTTDVAAMMVLLKLSRISWTPGKQDSWMDVAGYAACGWDCATNDLTLVKS